MFVASVLRRDNLKHTEQTAHDLMHFIRMEICLNEFDAEDVIVYEIDNKKGDIVARFEVFVCPQGYIRLRELLSFVGDDEI